MSALIIPLAWPLESKEFNYTRRASIIICVIFVLSFSFLWIFYLTHTHGLLQHTFLFLNMFTCFCFDVDVTMLAHAQLQLTNEWFVFICRAVVRFALHVCVASCNWFILP